MSDEAGREKKARHLDWHFKTKARMLDAEKRGQNRSWYVDEREWIASREYEDEAGLGDANGNPATVVSKKKTQDFVRAPADPVLRSLPCPIDQEPFKSEWSEEVQDFIWKDAVQVGNRIYHLSCYTEVTKGRDKDGVSTPVAGMGMGRTATPDSVLGKRKAEEDPGSIKSRIKLESAQA
jgi:pre-mRNA cleavage complex 2 protein Pcf11